MIGPRRVGRACGRGGLLAGLLALAGTAAQAGPTVPELVEVADIASLTLSPSGRLLAFRVERPSIERNGYQIDWYLADLATGAVRRLAGGGAPIYGDAGPLETEVAVWSPDERFVYHRAMIDGAIGLWRSAADGSGSSPALVADADVESLAPSADGTALTYALGPSREAIARAEQREYDEGILVDAGVDLGQAVYRGGSVHGRMASQRLVGRWYARAGLLWQAPRRRYRLDLHGLVTSEDGPVTPPSAAPLVPTASGGLVLAEPGRPTVWTGRDEHGAVLEVDLADGRLACAGTVCRGAHVVAMAWRPGTQELLFTTQDGHYRQALNVWDVQRDRVRTLVRGEGLLAGARDETRPCAVTEAAAVCVTASPLAPPRLERIELASGARAVLFDPNEALRGRATAQVERLGWTMADGRTAAGTVLLPRERQDPAPLFVSYYYCPGYLRGGTGDEFPLAPLVDAGFVVACVNMVPAASDDALDRYRDSLEAVTGLVDLLARRGLVDPRRVGMGGFSAGSEATMWVAMNSDLLAAAAIASPQYEPSAYWREALPGRDYASVLRAFIGLGSPDETPARWQLVSPALNTARIAAPLLMQLPESEARGAAELHARLARTATPVELYAFPDEGHVKMQPRHRAAAYRRSLDWFRYWLQDAVDPDPAKAPQYRRWDALRLKRDEAQASNARSQDSAADSSSSRM